MALSHGLGARIDPVFPVARYGLSLRGPLAVVEVNTETGSVGLRRCVSVDDCGRILNPLGVKVVGESATIGSTPVVVNAVLDALAPLGIKEMDPPWTPEKVWRAIERARVGASG